MEAKPGDEVKIFADRLYNGTLLPSLELTGKDTLILKLKNGYNIGISRSKIKKIEIEKKYMKPKSEKHAIRQDNSLPKVSVLSTGGTISSKIDYRTGGVFADYTAEDFIRMMPELTTIANITAKKVFSMMSEDMYAKDWIAISKEAQKEIKAGAQGIVITQGTDTLHYTAAALSFFFEKLPVPILITGSQRSIDRGSSDAFMNLLCSIKAAAEFDAGEVMTCLHGSSNDDYCILIRGTKVRKMDTSRRDAFRPINDIPLANVYPEKIEKLNLNYRKKAEKLELKAVFEENIALVYVYPGMDPDIIDFHIKKGIKGIVIAATALGHVNTWTEKSLIPKLEKCHKLKIPVIISSQTLYGRVDPYVYSNLRQVSIKANGLYVKDMHPETAFIKLGWVLGQENNYDKIRTMMLYNCRNEFSENLTPDMFLY